jgi:hypothetical protein
MNDDFPLTRDEFPDDFNYDAEETSLTNDELPLTSEPKEEARDTWRYEDNPMTQETRPIKPVGARREAISRVAEEQKSGKVVPPSMRGIPKMYSSEANQNTRRPNRDKNRPNADLPVRRALNPKPTRSQFAPFYVAMIVMAVAAVMILFLVLVGNIGNFGGASGTSEASGPIAQFFERAFFWRSPPATATPPENGGNFGFDERDFSRQTSLILAIRQTSDTYSLTLMNVADRRERAFAVSPTVQITSRTGVPMAFSELRVGMVVDISYDTEIARIAESQSARALRARTNVIIDMDTSTVTVGADQFTFNHQSLVLYRGEPFMVTQITPLDTVTIVAVVDTAWLIQLEAAHGFLVLTGTDDLINARLQAGNLFFLVDELDEPLVLAEGSHRIIVDADNIEPFIRYITVLQGQTITLNLEDAELRPADLFITVMPYDAEVFINGELVEPPGPIEVPFGELTIRVEREGYETETRTIDVTASVARVTVNLTEEVIPPDDSTLTIFTSPANAEIFIDGAFRGHAVLTVDLPPGTYTVVARLAGHTDTTYLITLGEGETQTRNLLLTPIIEAPPPPPDDQQDDYPPPIIPDDGEELPDVHPTNPFPNDDD